MTARMLSLVVLAAALVACDRNMDPYRPGEESRQPDLSRIFPEGAERAARAEQPMAGQMPPQPPARGTDASADAPPIRGVVELPEALAARPPPGAVLFLIARSGGAGPPLAVQRIAEPHFPLSFELGPRDRMIPSIPFAGELQLTARLDTDGNASSRSPGDLQGRAPGTHAPGASGVRIVLDEIL